MQIFSKQNILPESQIVISRYTTFNIKPRLNQTNASALAFSMLTGWPSIRLPCK